LIYKVIVPSAGLIQVGTFLALIDFEEGMSMTDLHSLASKRTIMVVDDEPEIVTVVRLMLEQKGFNVRCAYNGQQVFADLEEQKPDLIILDVMMPEMDGLEVLRRLKGAPETSSIPVVMLTALDQHEDIVRGYDTGADFYIPKPFTKDQLLDGINSILS
jgi:two-component system alkaline phosphatase synthesis response regulator PhoP